MNALPALWLPILATAVLVFVASSLIHMVFKWHNSDYRKLANEDEVRAALRVGSPPPGQYAIPHCTDMKELQGEVLRNKFREGPVGLITIKASGEPKMGGALGSWFLFNLVVATAAAAVALKVFGMQDGSHRVAQLVGVLSFATYAGGSIQNAIWMGKPWGSAAKDVLDALIYGGVSLMVFRWLWPGA